MKKTLIAAASACFALAAVFGGSAAASAHTPQASITCDQATVSLTSYDRHATADITLDGNSVHTGEFGGRLVETYPTVAGQDTHTLAVHVVSKDGSRYNYDDFLTATGCAPVTTPVITPHVQDYITCDGAAFVLDNLGSTVDVTYTVAGKDFVVPASTAVHTDADGYLFPTDIGPITISTNPGGKSWTFAQKEGCETAPPTQTEPPTSSTPEPSGSPSPSGTPTPPVVVPSGQPTEPTPTGTTGTPSTSPSATVPATAKTATAAPVAADTSRSELAYTGANMTWPIVGAAVFLLAGIALLVFGPIRRHYARR